MRFPIEPRPWPDKLQPPPPSAEGPTYRWYCTFVMPGEKAVLAAVVESVSRKDLLDFLHRAQRSGAAHFHSVNSIGFSGWEKSAPPPIDIEETIRAMESKNAREKMISRVAAVLAFPMVILALAWLFEWTFRK